MRVRCTSLLNTFAAFGSVFLLATACAPVTGDDAGPTDDAGQVPDAGDPTTPPGELQEGETCTVNSPQCAEGLLCLPSALNPNIGVCRVDCGLRNDQGQIVDEDPSQCTGDTGCLIVVDPTTLNVTALACLEPQDTRDEDCLAPLDEDACVDPYSCHVTYFNEGPDDPAPTSFNCKQECDLNAEDPECPAGEECFQSDIIQGVQEDDMGDPVVCTLATCEAGDAACECAEGFDCIALVGSAEGMGGCVIAPGVCGVPQDGLSIDELNAGEFAGNLCNGVDDHLYCNNAQFEGLENPGASICFYQGALGDNYTGFCYEICSIPAADIDGDGTLEAGNDDAGQPDELGEELQCPEGKGCYLDLGRELLVGPGVEDEDGPFGVRECNPDNCTPGEPCNAECGPGDTECITFPANDGNTYSLCIAPYGNCEPLRDEPTPDDAGTPDAGDADAGTDADAGAADAG